MRALFICTAVVWSIGCSSKKQPPVATHSPLADSADQVMYGMRFNLTDKGLERAQLQSDTAYFFDDNTRIELEKVHTTFFTVTGAKNAVLTSERGTYNSRTSNMVARKNVVVVSEDGRRLTTPELIYNQQRNEISSDSAFVMTEPNRRLEGVGFRSDPDMKNIQILKGASGIVRGVSTQTTPGSTTAPAGTTPPASTTPTASTTPPAIPKR
ncbi:MAG: LPS export ABC transporter periplasmic protein LptC [Gemmatimonadota bacterium]|nr:LPS export ABC transporter periplasmic protein LptC [Gemmatimonadota bacterium]